METAKQKEKEVKKIVLEFNDGSTEVIEKGLVATFEDNETITFKFANMGGNDLKAIVYGIINLGERLGMFNDEDN